MHYYEYSSKMIRWLKNWAEQDFANTIKSFPQLNFNMHYPVYLNIKLSINVIMLGYLIEFMIHVKLKCLRIHELM